MTLGTALPHSLQGEGGTQNGQNKLKSQPAILLFRSVDAIKQENGAWRPLRNYAADFT